MKYAVFVGYFVFLNQVLTGSTCEAPSFNNLTVQDNFNLTKFLGIWFEIEWLPGVAHNQSDIWVNYYQSFQLDNSSNGTYLQVPGRARGYNNDTCFSFGPWLILANNSAKMILMKKSLVVTTNLNRPFYVLTTDYENYALVYGCVTVNYTLNVSCPNPILWVFSRSTSLSISNQLMLSSYIENVLCVNLTQLEVTDQDGQQCYSSSITKLTFNILLIIFLFVLSL